MPPTLIYRSCLWLSLYWFIINLSFHNKQLEKTCEEEITVLNTKHSHTPPFSFTNVLRWIGYHYRLSCTNWLGNQSFCSFGGKETTTRLNLRRGWCHSDQYRSCACVCTSARSHAKLHIASRPHAGGGYSANPHGTVYHNPVTNLTVLYIS